MSERLKINHPMQYAEQKLQQLDVRHAPIQAFGEDGKIAGLDGRFVCAFDPPGIYYILGCDNAAERGSSENREKIQLIFWRSQNRASALQLPLSSAMDTAAAIAAAIGWKVESISKIPVVGPESENIKSVVIAILAMPEATAPPLQESLAS